MRTLCRDALKFVPAKSGNPPEILTPLSDMYGEQGRSVRFECEIEGSPRPEFRWFRGLRELADTPKYTILSKGNTQVNIFKEHF